MKKISLLLAALILMSAMLFACGNGDNTSSEPSSSHEEASSEALSSEEPSSEEPSSEEESSEEPAKEPVTTPVIEEYESMKFKKAASAVYITTPQASNGCKIFTSMVKTSWGTWNLGQYTVTNNGKSVTMNPGGTDWEYVYRVSETAGSTQFCGGNHGNEALIDITFFDASNGEELNPADFSEVDCNGVKAVEHTQIYFANQPEKPFVNVTRTYTFNGVDVWLECDYDFIKDAYFTLSYTAMFCIPKTSGNHIVYNNIDGTTDTFETALSGTKSGKDYGGDFDYGHKAPSVELWGDNNPEYRMHVEIYDDEVMAGNYSTKYNTFFWDMNKSQNKLYFSKFGDSAQKVENGSHWDTLTRWSFYLLTD